MAEVGRIAVLNGPSSSGKTTLARLTRDLIGVAAVALSIDDLYRSIHQARRNDWALFLSLSRVLFDTAASFAHEGFDVLVDTVFERVACHEACLARLGPFHPLLVRLDCAIDVLVERERMRADRRAGLAADQANRVHAGCRYDLVVDTGTTLPDQCAKQIALALGRLPLSS